jgi:hypothetical protein
MIGLLRQQIRRNPVLLPFYVHIETFSIIFLQSLVYNIALTERRHMKGGNL